LELLGIEFQMAPSEILLAPTPLIECPTPYSPKALYVSKFHLAPNNPKVLLNVISEFKHNRTIPDYPIYSSRQHLFLNSKTPLFTLKQALDKANRTIILYLIISTYN